MCVWWQSENQADVALLLTCVVRIISYRSSFGTGTGAGFFTKESCLMLPRKLLAFGFGGWALSSCALWSSSRRAWAVATSSKNSSLCSEVMEEKTTVEKWEKRALMVRWRDTWKWSVARETCKFENISWVTEYGWFPIVSAWSTWVSITTWKQMRQLHRFRHLNTVKLRSHLCWLAWWCWAQSGTSASWARPPAWRSSAGRWAASPPEGCRAARTVPLGSQGLTGEPERTRVGDRERTREVGGRRKVFLWVALTICWHSKRIHFNSYVLPHALCQNEPCCLFHHEIVFLVEYMMAGG